MGISDDYNSSSYSVLEKSRINMKIAGRGLSGERLLNSATILTMISSDFRNAKSKLSDSAGYEPAGQTGTF